MTKAEVLKMLEGLDKVSVSVLDGPDPESVVVEVRVGEQWTRTQLNPANYPPEHARAIAAAEVGACFEAAVDHHLFPRSE